MTTLMSGAMSARTVAGGAGERIWIAGDTMWLKATAADTGGAYTLLEVLAAPGGGPPPHIHVNEDETFYVLDGVFELLIGPRVVRAEAGTYAFVPRGTIHRFRCIGGRSGRMLVMFTPGGIEEFFRTAGTPAIGDEPPPPIDAQEIARTEVAAARYGLRVVDWGSEAPHRADPSATVEESWLAG
jgi:quercetin dioxygenase-like cupin family protein